MPLPLYIAHASSSSVLIPLVIALLSRKHITRDLLPLVILLIIALMSDVISLVFFQLGMNSYLIVNLFLLVQFFSLLPAFVRSTPGDHYRLQSNCNRLHAVVFYQPVFRSGHVEVQLLFQFPRLPYSDGTSIALPLLAAARPARIVYPPAALLLDCRCRAHLLCR